MFFYEIYNNDVFKMVEYAKGTDWEGIVCPKYEGHQRSGNRIGKLKINIRGKKNGDFLWSFLSECIITNKVAEIFHQNKVTGFELKPVEVTNIEISYNLWEFVVIGKGGEANKDSGIYLKNECIYCGLKRYSAYENGIIVDERNWDGSDIFTVEGYPKHILVTEKVKDIIITYKLTGVKFTPAHELKWPEGVIKP